MTSIPSPHIDFPEDFGGEPEKIWRLWVDGSAELVAQEEAAILRNHVVKLSPNMERYFYFEQGACIDGDYGVIHVRSLGTGVSNLQLPCATNFPLWTPDGEHFIFWDDHWRLGNVFDATTIRLDFLDLAAQHATAPPRITWIDETHFLLTLRMTQRKTVSLATLDGIVAQLPSTGSGFSFSLSH